MERRGALGGVPLWALGAVAAVAAVAWLAGGAIAGRQVAAGLPSPPSEGVSAPVRDAIVAADRAARPAPSAATAGALGIAYHAAQRPTEALAAYAVAVRLGRRDPRWTYLSALLHEERGDDAAVAALQQVVEAAPAHGLAWFRLGELAFKRGRLDEAAAAYARARDAAPAAPFLPPGVASRSSVPLATYARLGLARIALERGQGDAALSGAAGNPRGVSGIQPGDGVVAGTRPRAQRRAGGRRDGVRGAVRAAVGPRTGRGGGRIGRYRSVAQARRAWPPAPATRRGASSCSDGRWPPTRRISTC